MSIVCAPRGGHRRPHAIGLALLAVLAGLAVAPATAEARPVTRADVVRLSREAPAARAARARAQGVRAAAEESGPLALDNPELSATVGPRIGDQTTDLAIGAGLSVPLDLLGQRGARIEAAEAEARAAEAAARSASSAPLRDALELHAAALAARARRAVFADRLRLVEELAASTTRRRQAGEIPENDIAVVRMQLGRERAALAVLEGDVAALERRLAAVLALPEGETAEATGPLVPTEAPSGRAATPLAVAASEAELAAARARLGREEAARRPTIRLLASYELDEGAHIVTGGLALPLPLYGIGSSAVAAARGEANAAAHTLEGTRRRLAAEREAARLRSEATRRALDATRPAAAEAQAIVERAQRAYTAGESDVATLLLVRREALESQLAVIDAEVAHTLAILDALLLEGRWSR